MGRPFGSAPGLVASLASWSALLLPLTPAWAGYQYRLVLGRRRLLKALFTTGWLEGENPLLTTLAAAYELVKTRARSSVATTLNLIAKAITSVSNTSA